MVEVEVVAVVGAAAQEVAILQPQEVLQAPALLHTVLHQRDLTPQFQFILTIVLPTITIVTTTTV